MPVLDASVYVAIANQADRYHERCLRWLEASLGRGEALAGPTLLAVEVAAAVRRLTGRQSLADRVSNELEEDELVELVPLTAERSRQAATIAAATGVRGADAVYLGLASELGEPLVTLDRQQLERGRVVVEVRRPSR